AVQDPSISHPRASAPPLEKIQEAARQPTPETAAVVPPTAKPEVAAPARSLPTVRTVTLVATFVRPDNSKIEVERARVDLIDATGRTRSAVAAHATQIEMPEVAT